MKHYSDLKKYDNMKKTIKRFYILFTLALLTFSVCFSQEAKEVYIRKDKAPADNILSSYDTGRNNCEGPFLSVGDKGELIISDKLDETTFLVVVSKNNKGQNMAEKNKYYSASSGLPTFNNSFQAQRRRSVSDLRPGYSRILKFQPAIADLRPQVGDPAAALHLGFVVGEMPGEAEYFPFRCFG